MEENNAVETINEEAAIVEDGVENLETIAPESHSQDVDYEALLREKDKELEKLARERENYKQGMLRAKGKASEEELFADEVSQEDRIRSMIREEMLSTESAKLAQEREEILARALRENKELRLSNKTKSQKGSAPVASSTNQERPKSDVPFWTEAQLAVMKSRNIDPEKAKENYLALKKASY